MLHHQIISATATKGPGSTPLQELVYVLVVIGIALCLLRIAHLALIGRCWP